MQSAKIIILSRYSTKAKAFMCKLLVVTKTMSKNFLMLY